MSAETVQVSVQPVFDPQNVGQSLDILMHQLPLSKLYLKGSVLGEIQSLSKGDGFDFDGLHDFEDGDDARDIDWNATASDPSGLLQVREHYEDITPTFTGVTDMLQRRHQVNPGYFSEQNLAISALLALTQLADRHGLPTRILGINEDSVAVRQRRPSSGRRHTLQLAQQLASGISANQSMDCDSRPHLSNALLLAGQHCTEQVVVVVSDFRDVVDPASDHGWEQPLLQLREQGNDLIAVELTNVFDHRLPIKADRTGGHWITDKDRHRYAKRAESQQAQINEAIALSGARHIKLSTANPEWMKSLVHQLQA